MSKVLIHVKREKGNVYCVEPGLDRHPESGGPIWVSDGDKWDSRLATKLITIFKIVGPIEFAWAPG